MHIFSVFSLTSLVCPFVLTLGSFPLLSTGGQTFYFAIIRICDKLAIWLPFTKFWLVIENLAKLHVGYSRVNSLWHCRGKIIKLTRLEIFTQKGIFETCNKIWETQFFQVLHPAGPSLQN